LAAAYPATTPSETDDEVVAAALDAWITGVVSSEDSFTSASVRDLVDLLAEVELDGPATDLVERTLDVVRPDT
jgi:hypothetical protein